MHPVDLVKLKPLMSRTSGHRDLKVALIDGPVVTNHAGFDGATIQTVETKTNGACTVAKSFACGHGTFVAGILSAKRDSGAPGICPGCTLLVHPIFPETNADTGQTTPSATPDTLADAILESITATNECEQSTNGTVLISSTSKIRRLAARDEIGTKGSLSEDG